MSIRVRLILSFMGIIVLVGMVGAFLIYSGSARDRLYKDVILSHKVSSLAKEISYFLDQQLRSFDFYVLFDDADERNNFNDYKQTIREKFIEWKRLNEPDARSQGDIARLEDIYKDVVSSADKVISLKGRGSRQQALDVVDSQYTPKEKSFRAQIKDTMDKKALLASNFQAESAELANKITVVSLMFIAAMIVLGIGLSIYIFRFISRPLLALQKGALEIGAGNLDYTIKLAQSKDEFGKLAQSFNEMSLNLRKMQAQIIQLDRMSAMGQLAGGVAHELNNPLTGVLGQSQILLGRMPPDDPSRAHIEKIERAALRCRKIVRELLDFSRQKEYHFMETNIHELIDATLLLCESDLAASMVSVVKNFDSSVDLIQVSPPHIQQVFLNLINNALHAMKPGGTLTVSTRMLKSGVTVRDRRRDKEDIVLPGKWLEVRFIDTGMGIPPENLQHIFDPFFTTKEVGKGTGLGLTISYGIVQNHKGTIFAESAGPNKGSTLTVRLAYQR